MPGTQVWIHTDKQRAAGQVCSSTAALGPRPASPGGIAGGTIAKITHLTTQTIGRLWLKGNLFQAKQSTSSASSPSSFLNKVSALHGEPARTCSTTLQPSAYMEMFGISEKAGRTRTAEFFAAVCLRNKASPLQDERNQGVYTNQILHACWLKFSLSVMQLSGVINIFSAMSLVEGENTTARNSPGCESNRWMVAASKIIIISCKHAKNRCNKTDSLVFINES